MRRAPLRSLLNFWTALIAVVLVANLVAFASWTLPRWSARRGVSGATGKIRDARQRIEPRLQLARDTYGRLVSAETDLEAFRADLMTTAGASELMALLVEAGADAGIVIDDATFQLAPIQELGVVQLGINLPIVGTYEAVRALLDELIALPVFLVIDGVGLQAMSGSSATRGAVAAAEAVSVELAISVFVGDSELAAAAGQVAVGARSSARASAQEARLLAAAQGDDPDELADALFDRLASLPPLPVDPDALDLRLDRLEPPSFGVEPQRNLFSVVLPPVVPPSFEEDPELLVGPEPEPSIPVRLLGVMLVEGRWRASLTDGVDLFVVEAGDSLPNGVEVLEVGVDFADLLFGEERTRLSLEGNER